MPGEEGLAILFQSPLWRRLLPCEAAKGLGHSFCMASRVWPKPAPCLFTQVNTANLFNSTLTAALTFLMNSGMSFWSVRWAKEEQQSNSKM